MRLFKKQYLKELKKVGPEEKVIELSKKEKESITYSLYASKKPNRSNGSWKVSNVQVSS